MLDTSHGTEHARRRVRPLSAASSLKASAVSTITMGTALAIAPGFAVWVVGAGGGTAGGPWTRATGGALIVFGLLFAAASRWPASMMQRPVMLSAALVATVAATAGFLALAGDAHQWPIPLAIEAPLAAWLWWLLIADRV